MSSTPGNSSRSWRAIGSYPASDGTDADTPDPEIEVPPENSGRPDLPTPEDRLRGIVDEYGDRVLRPVSEVHGRKLREEALTEAETVEREVETGETETKTVSDTVGRDARSWLAVIDEFLQDYEGYRDRALRMARGDDLHGDYESFLVDLENSFSPGYQQTQYARLKAMKRMLLGESADESPTGEEYPGVFEEPVTVLFGLTASTLDAEEFRPVVDHDREIRDAWSGSDGVRRTLRYVLQDKLGLDATDYAWWWQSEPHPGGGDAAGCSHSHPVVVLDAAAVSAGPDPADPETYRPVVAKHVAECEHAEWSAHRIREGSDKSAVKVREGDDITDFAGYVSEYIAVDPDTDLLERSDEYIMWAASQWASTTQKYSKSRTATAAIRADRCHQEYRDGEAHQDHDHGERVVRSERPGVEYECAGCGSEFEVDQSPETLVEARRVASDGGLAAASGSSGPSPVSFDHGAVEVVASPCVDCEPSVGDAVSGFRGRWSSARGGARVGGETTVVRTRPEEHERTPEFSPVRFGGGDDYCSACGGTDPDGDCPADAYKEASYDGLCPVPPEHYGEHTVVEGHDDADQYAEHTGKGYRGTGHIELVPVPAVVRPSASESFDRPPGWRPEAIVQQRSGEETEIGTPGGVDYGEVVVEGADAIPPEKLVPPRLLRCADPMDRHGIDPVEYPPPELIERQLAEVHQGERITAKRWDDGWHEERHGVANGGDGSEPDGPLPWASIKRYREKHPGATVADILDEFDIPESKRTVVGGVFGPPE